jgi:zinc D-Ala-D-Ala carboxypeptidase
VTRFQQAYGLAADGVAGSATFTKFYALQDDDCTPIHFTYAELDDGCGGSGYDGGPLSEAATRANALQTMWQLEALRHALGDKSLTISSGFRSIPCNRQVGGASNSEHLYGRSADVVGVHSFCTIVKQARYHGFGGILGPGFPGHDDHAHIDIRTSNYWSAPSCGI